MLRWSPEAQHHLRRRDDHGFALSDAWEGLGNPQEVERTVMLWLEAMADDTRDVSAVAKDVDFDARKLQTRHLGS